MDLDDKLALQHITQSTLLDLDDKETMQLVTRSTEVDLDDGPHGFLRPGILQQFSQSTEVDLDEDPVDISRLPFRDQQTDLAEVVLDFELSNTGESDSILWERSDHALCEPAELEIGELPCKFSL